MCAVAGATSAHPNDDEKNFFEFFSRFANKTPFPIVVYSVREISRIKISFGGKHHE